MQHDTVTVKTFLRLVLKMQQGVYCHVLATLMYFSDGAASQHKNHKKNFHHLCWHKHEFGLSAEWHFFATS